MGTRLEATALCHRGLKRTTNQDGLLVGPWLSTRSSEIISHLTLPLDEPLLVAVADGMGGHADGARASELALGHMAMLHPIPPHEEALALALSGAHDALFDDMAARPDARGMGTTFAGVVVDGTGEIVWANVGDSRVYRESGDYLVQLSIDDSAASGHLTQSLGGTTERTTVHPHVGREPVGDDRVLLCSDGLSGRVKVDDMEDALIGVADDEAMERLWSLIVQAGAPDNVTIVLLRVHVDV